MDDHDKSTELGLETEGEYLSEKEIRDLAKGEEDVDYPMPGEKNPEKHSTKMPENVEFIDESGKKIV